ncbi:hypothetical protein PR048_015381 [Dryococelus australis]|uniref:DDE-1 domain-containing protein n=1 Tax=Dryococelus australis TaxID=614101 RepID=A0ABQ9HH24_9NEOP|nr:hypothetical protein PR048_015381 [Dryococelus australis]
MLQMSKWPVVQNAAPSHTTHWISQEFHIARNLPSSYVQEKHEPTAFEGSSAWIHRGMQSFRLDTNFHIHILVQTFRQYIETIKRVAFLLLLDGHSSHQRNIDVINIAREIHVTLLHLSLHTTHKLQQLERTLMELLKSYYWRLQDVTPRLKYGNRQYQPRKAKVNVVFARRVGKKAVQCWDTEIGCAQPERSVYLIISMCSKQDLMKRKHTSGERKYSATAKWNVEEMTGCPTAEYETTNNKVTSAWKVEN